MRDSDDIHFKNFLLDANPHPTKKKLKKFKIIENPEPPLSKIEEKSKIETFTTLKREPVSDLSEELDKIEEELMQNNVKKKHILHKTEDVIVKKSSLNDNFGKSLAPIFKTKKFLHKKIENGISKIMHCVNCKSNIPFSTTDLKCPKCINNNFINPKDENIILKDVIKFDGIKNKHKKFLAKKFEKNDEKNTNFDNIGNQFFTFLRDVNQTECVPSHKNQNESSNSDSSPSRLIPLIIKSEIKEIPNLPHNINEAHLSSNYEGYNYEQNNLTANNNIFSNMTIPEVKQAFMKDWIQNELKRVELSDSLTHSLKVLNNLFNMTASFKINNNFSSPQPMIQNNQSYFDYQTPTNNLIQQQFETQKEEKLVFKNNVDLHKKRVFNSERL